MLVVHVYLNNYINVNNHMLKVNKMIRHYPYISFNISLFVLIKANITLNLDI